MAENPKPENWRAEAGRAFKGQTMNKWQVKVLNECPTSYRSTLERAYAGGSRTAAIRGFCLRCVGFMRNEIRDCTSYGCPLHPYRPYQADNEPDELLSEIT